MTSCEIQWSRYKFDDERVTKEELRRALEEQYGGEEEFPQTNPGFNNTPFKFTKYSNAYMLVYIRWADKDKVICNVDEKDIAEHLQVAVYCDTQIFFQLSWSKSVKLQVQFTILFWVQPC
jgi:hypothetical protein